MNAGKTKDGGKEARSYYIWRMEGKTAWYSTRSIEM